MDYQKFFAEVAAWVLEVNKQAVKYGMDSDPFWKWIVQSSTDICEQYGNNKLVINQMVMLVDWVQDIYSEMQSKKEAAG
jgi:hypothetical protein